MYTLVYLNGNLNRPDTLPFFLQSNVGKTPLLQIDCVTPFQGTAEERAEKVCSHLNAIDPQVEVKIQEIKNTSTESAKSNKQVHFMVLQLLIIG
jgi:hypothetical protein